jgi:NAD(P)-dependent dehydrogenase (short-subunit alcohol dehydrogenase family)
MTDTAKENASMSHLDFSDRVVIVTGAGKGIGQACALAFARMGATVVMSGRSGKPLEETQEKIASLGATCAIYEGDVADESTAEGTVARANRVRTPRLRRE